jgi:hypothetical protein
MLEYLPISVPVPAPLPPAPYPGLPAPLQPLADIAKGQRRRVTRRDVLRRPPVVVTLQRQEFPAVKSDSRGSSPHSRDLGRRSPRRRASAASRLSRRGAQLRPRLASPTNQCARTWRARRPTFVILRLGERRLLPRRLHYQVGPHRCRRDGHGLAAHHAAKPKTPSRPRPATQLQAGDPSRGPATATSAIGPVPSPVAAIQECATTYRRDVHLSQFTPGR